MTVDERAVAAVLASGIAVAVIKTGVVVVETLVAANRRPGLAATQIRRHKRKAAQKQAER
jgi:hypothetical protein